MNRDEEYILQELNLQPYSRMHRKPVRLTYVHKHTHIYTCMNLHTVGAICHCTYVDIIRVTTLHDSFVLHVWCSNGKLKIIFLLLT